MTAIITGSSTKVKVATDRPVGIVSAETTTISIGTAPPLEEIETGATPDHAQIGLTVVLQPKNLDPPLALLTRTRTDASDVMSMDILLENVQKLTMM